MKKCRASVVWAMVVLAVLGMSLGAAAEQYDGFSYEAHYVTYDRAAVEGWTAMDYAETTGVLLSMYSDTAEVSVSLMARSDAPTLDALAEQQVASVSSYGTVLSNVEKGAWYAPWLDSEPGLRAAYSYAFLDGTGEDVYQVVDYMAPLDDDNYVLVRLTDRSGDVERTASALEAGLLEGFGIGSFSVTGSVSAYLTGASEKDGQVYLTLQPFEVEMDEDQLDYSVKITGETQVTPLSPEARMLAPQGGDLGMLQDVTLTADAINAFIDGYRSSNGTDCVFNILMSDGMARWITYSYLY